MEEWKILLGMWNKWEEYIKVLDERWSLESGSSQNPSIDRSRKIEISSSWLHFLHEAQVFEEERGGRCWRKTELCSISIEPRVGSETPESCAVFEDLQLFLPSSLGTTEALVRLIRLEAQVRLGHLAAKLTWGFWASALPCLKPEVLDKVLFQDLLVIGVNKFYSS